MARRASNGHFQDRKLFIGLTKVMLLKEDHEHSGKQLKGAMKYSAEFDQFCHVLVVTSPHAYQIIRQSFAGRRERSFRAIRAKDERFQLGIMERNFKMVRQYLKKLDYNGPLGVSVDDTECHPDI
ncbi:hypothetical protein BT69DRAFT_1234856 [Atractiella rhizophila]|nr:hypothetical protein BT69DRAFT_1234856 [Atractiella rhizophila]